MVGLRSIRSSRLRNANAIIVVPLPRLSFALVAHRAYCFKCGRDAISARELAPNGVKQILGRSFPLFDFLSFRPALRRAILHHRICGERQEGRSAVTTRVLPRSAAT